MIEVDGLDGLGQQAALLERSLGGAGSVAAQFNGELAKMRESLGQSGRDLDTFGGAVGRSLRSAFDDVAFEGGKLSDALKGVATAMAESAFSIAFKPVQEAAGGAVSNGISSLLGGLFAFRDGGAFSSGRVTAFAKGGVVAAPTQFPMRGGRGLMGEAGPEAIMPLTRTADGRLGVQSQGGGRAVNVTMNVSTSDAQSFARSQSQIAARLGRMLARGERNR